MVQFLIWKPDLPNQLSNSQPGSNSPSNALSPASVQWCLPGVQHGVGCSLPRRVCFVVTYLLNVPTDIPATSTSLWWIWLRLSWRLWELLRPNQRLMLRPLPSLSGHSPPKETALSSTLPARVCASSAALGIGQTLMPILEGIADNSSSDELMDALLHQVVDSSGMWDYSIGT